ncbi:MAG: DUF2927 domain-containing protein, partial [Mangrovicoccus sp.]|nr:DUF2927 domain-containing protein [Mangrovicoccus sp.]
SSVLPCHAGSTVARRQGDTESPLARYYRDLEQGFLSRGQLRQDGGPMALDPSLLSESFREIALSREYGSKDAPLMRWEEPVRMAVRFAPSISKADQATHVQTVRAYANRLERISGHEVRFQDPNPNFVVMVAAEAEIRGLAPWLRANVPGLSDRTIRTITRMPAGHLCMVVAVPHDDIRNGYRSAIAIVRAEHTPLMRQSCIEEELAQGMGLPNDCKGPRPSIFNDDEQYGVLTRHDEMLLRALYSPRLHSGMRREQAMPVVAEIFAQTPG